MSPQEIIIDGRVKRRIENFVQQQNFKSYDKSLSKGQLIPPNCKVGKSLSAQNITSSIQTAKKYTKAGQAHPKAAETRTLRPTFTRTKEHLKSSHICCSTNKNYSSTLMYADNVNSSMKLSAFPQAKILGKHTATNGRSFAKISCKYDSPYCARLQSVLIHETEKKNCKYCKGGF